MRKTIFCLLFTSFFMPPLSLGETIYLKGKRANSLGYALVACGIQSLKIENPTEGESLIRIISDRSTTAYDILCQSNELPHQTFTTCQMRSGEHEESPYISFGSSNAQFLMGQLKKISAITIERGHSPPSELIRVKKVHCKRTYIDRTCEVTE